MGAAAQQGKIGLQDFVADLFDPLVGTTLVFERPCGSEPAGQGPARMKLLEVHRGAKPLPALRQPFSLLFVVKDQPPLGTGLHRLVYPGFEPADLFISRVMAPEYQAIDPLGMYYQAVFG
jgi:hypothetical protein